MKKARRLRSGLLPLVSALVFAAPWAFAQSARQPDPPGRHEGKIDTCPGERCCDPLTCRKA